jgi:hypothetical protein
MQRPSWILAASAALTLAILSGCSDDSKPSTPAVVEQTPASISLNFLGRHSSGEFLKSAAEITAYDAASKRAFVVNALSGKVDVLDLSNPANPVKIAGNIDATSIEAGASINSVAVHDGIVAVAIQAADKTDNGYVAIYRASDLSKIAHVDVGAQPDMLTFTPDGKTLLVANEGEPSDDYQIDPNGSISVISVATPTTPVIRTARFTTFNGQEATLRAQGIRLYGPNANTARDLEPEYIAVAADGTTAWVTLQENNALAKIDIATATVTALLPLGEKNHGTVGNELDLSDGDSLVNIRTWEGVKGLYQPDSIGAYTAADGHTYLVMANEGDARAWGETNSAYWAGDASKGFVEEFRVKHLINKSGWAGRINDDLPPQLSAMAAGGLLNPTIFGHCGAVAGDPKNCRTDAMLGRLKITWTMGYQTNADGSPKKFTAAGVEDPAGDRLMYDTLYTFGARSFSIRDANGALIWDSAATIEQFLAGDDCKLGKDRLEPCKNWFNANHEKGNSKDARSAAKGPEPEGLTVGRIGNKTFVFVGLERMGGILVYDITTPAAPIFMDYLNTREDFATADPSTVLAAVGDLGPEGLHFVPAAKSPNGKALLIVGNEVSGTTAVYEIRQTF